MTYEDDHLMDPCTVGAHKTAMLATPLGELELAAVLRDSYTHVFGDPPTANCLAVAWSQCATEHGRGRFIWCHNIGNVSAFGGWPGDYYVLHVQEQQQPGVWKWVDMRFRAHDDFIDGARDYWTILQHHYNGALVCFDKGDPSGAAAALKAAHYFTANLLPYQHDMVSLFGYAQQHVLVQL